jgi:hypothetical protein
MKATCQRQCEAIHVPTGNDNSAPLYRQVNLMLPILVGF